MILRTHVVDFAALRFDALLCICDIGIGGAVLEVYNEVLHVSYRDKKSSIEGTPTLNYDTPSTSYRGSYLGSNANLPLGRHLHVITSLRWRMLHVLGCDSHDFPARYLESVALAASQLQCYSSDCVPAAHVGRYGTASQQAAS